MSPRFKLAEFHPPATLLAAINACLGGRRDEHVARCVAVNTANNSHLPIDRWGSESFRAAYTLAHQFYHGPGFPQFALDLVQAKLDAVVGGSTRPYYSPTAKNILDHARNGLTGGLSWHDDRWHQPAQKVADDLYAHFHGRKITTPGAGAGASDELDQPSAGQAMSPDSGPVAAGSTPAPGAPTGVKFDQGKLRFDLVPWRALEKVVRVLMYGAEKYTLRDEAGNVIRDGSQNWRKVPELQERYQRAAFRHGVADMKGEQFDPESGLEHLAHRVCCDLFRLEDLALEEEEGQ